MYKVDTTKSRISYEMFNISKDRFFELCAIMKDIVKSVNCTIVIEKSITSLKERRLLVFTEYMYLLMSESSKYCNSANELAFVAFHLRDLLQQEVSWMDKIYTKKEIPDFNSLGV